MAYHIHQGLRAPLAVAILLFRLSDAFLVSPTMPTLRTSRQHATWTSTMSPPMGYGFQKLKHRRGRKCNKVSLSMNLNSDDPFQVLGMEEPTSDKKVIKRAYKRMALKYHPDVATTKDSTPEEKKMASDRFAKINWAYEVLSGKRENDSTYSSGSSRRPSSSSREEWTPPHRRSGSNSSGSPSSSSSSYSAGDGADWTDFMPKDYSEQYDTGGDSFGKIFSDLFVGAAVGAAGMGVGGGPSLFRDFVEFLEGNVDGFGGPEDDTELSVLLNSGSVDDIGNEMDDTDLVVQQLKSKLRTINDEIMTQTAEISMTTRYMEKMELEESLAELNARKEVVEGYVKKAQKRLLTLQTRYKELITRGQKDSYAGGKTSSSTWSDVRNEASTSSATSSSSSSTDSTSSGSSYSSQSSSRDSMGKETAKGENSEDSWMNESFGSSSYGRGRGGSRRRSRRSRSQTDRTGHSEYEARQAARSNQRTSSTTDSASSRFESNQWKKEEMPSRGPGKGSSSRTSGSYGGDSSSSIRSTPSGDGYVPPHRRTSTSYRSQKEEDKRRMRELQVDDEFEKLKKDLGL